jgi:hypothetical protein
MKCRFSKKFKQGKKYQSMAITQSNLLFASTEISIAKILTVNEIILYSKE